MCLAFVIVLLLSTAAPGGDVYSGRYPGQAEDVQTLVAVGDIMLSGSAASVLAEKGYGHPFRNPGLSSLIASADVAFANLEYPITRSKDRFKKKYTFKGSSASLAAIRKAGFTMMSLANNHIMDFGPEGMFSTIESLRMQNIVYAGAGTELGDARSLKVLKKNGVRYGLLAYSLTFPMEFWATLTTPGTVYANRAYLEHDIPSARKKVDILIVSFHWGEELKYFPKQYQVDLGRLAVDLGASVVLGHHPHVPQAIEIYKDAPIFYSLGNFAFGSCSYNAPFSYVAQIFFAGYKPVKVKLHPINVFNPEVEFQPRYATGEAGADIITFLQEISTPFGTIIEPISSGGLITIGQKGDQVLTSRNP